MLNSVGVSSSSLSGDSCIISSMSSITWSSVNRDSHWHRRRWSNAHPTALSDPPHLRCQWARYHSSLSLKGSEWANAKYSHGTTASLQAWHSNNYLSGCSKSCPLVGGCALWWAPWLTTGARHPSMGRRTDSVSPPLNGGLRFTRSMQRERERESESMRLWWISEISKPTWRTHDLNNSIATTERPKLSYAKVSHLGTKASKTSMW